MPDEEEEMVLTVTIPARIVADAQGLLADILSAIEDDGGTVHWELKKL